MSRNAIRYDLPDRRELVTPSAAIAALVPLSGSALATTRLSQPAKRRPRTDKTFETAALLRDLWIGHIFWIRAVSIATIEKREAAAAAAELKAVANARSIAGTIEPFYGTAAKDTFSKLLTGHYGAVTAYLMATIADDAAGQRTATRSLTSIAEEIASFLSQANPHFPKDAVNNLLLAHGDHHIRQIRQLKDRNYEAEAHTWEEMKDHIYQIADTTADALAKQFADEFS